MATPSQPSSSSPQPAQPTPHHPPPPRPIRACLFDMDGLLLDSEDKYTTCTNAILSRYNRPPLPWHIKAQLQGRPGPQAGAIFESWAQLPVSRDVYMKEVSEMQRELFPTCQALPGVEGLLAGLEGRGVRLALATSSHSGNFALKTGHLGELFGCFGEEHRVLGDDGRIPAGRGKPAPDIYLVALETINARLRREGGREVEAGEALVFEDSVPGVEAGRRAGCQVVWCPHPELLELMRGKEELILAGRTGQYEEEGKDKGEVGEGKGRSKDAPGEIGDGWGRLLRTLENFPYEDYGLEA
ncbi:hypothetical protein LTS16_008857 [Friedmanniomyces endolithicus]|nr:hypothetical protein LTR94_019462 [Friedmanniomyces endolithicus]KAK0777008.1 hypothetical protein LTR38_015322 [Friedmanniomyces endolithicus]KAK0794626.1 hypothetical protein LTR75_010779 [Friedmanniomyces endolithicus]KAK0804306.1 hypothetical protein LTR59_004436 [Friedmanniomyces endolithicus]KAK0831799.1 hypothetical protein LTR03_015440 [Friedmanniomyces endolithicus]